jgi:hypothetical protein
MALSLTNYLYWVIKIVQEKSKNLFNLEKNIKIERRKKDER